MVLSNVGLKLSPCFVLRRRDMVVALSRDHLVCGNNFALGYLSTVQLAIFLPTGMQPVRNPQALNTIRAGSGGMGKSGGGITMGGRGGDVLISYPHILHVYHCYSGTPPQNPVIPTCYSDNTCGMQRHALPGARNQHGAISPHEYPHHPASPPSFSPNPSAPHLPVDKNTRGGEIPCPMNHGHIGEYCCQFTPRMCTYGDQHQSWAAPLSECHCTMHTDPSARVGKTKGTP
ncbi:hypothetical protein BS47DRAFT_856862 [Hydnum rufescens UP504]|uniref:Uncharacterized protein n=1 Tax=Hydnum rufescens UP504 TaxID=1448309 RepID=A0A9P6AZG4_9AGAM|nr:hypothetical protein BS47DRAFT_856862 [Hydnum rufescens UP504]